MLVDPPSEFLQDNETPEQWADQRVLMNVNDAQIAALVPGAVHITNTDSGHNIHMIQPQLVAGAIADVVAALREGRSTAQP